MNGESPEPVRKGRQRARLIDVAKRAGVSLGSASRALSSPELVKPKTLNAVRAAAAELDYVPDGTARSLKMRRSLMIGSVLPTVNNPVYADFVHALQNRLGASGYGLLVSAHEYDPIAEIEIVGRLLQRGVDGVILVGTDHDPRVIEQLIRFEIPYIYTWSTDDEGVLRSVGFSNRRAMQQLAHHVIQLGHRDIAVLSGATENNERARARLAGIMDAALLAGIDIPSENILFGDFTVQAGREGLRRAMALDPRPTALICSTDLVAAGALSEAAELGVRVPEDLSITGFDDIVYASLLTPRLTTIHVPASELGTRAAQAILGLIEGQPMESCALVPRMIVRGSTGPAPGR